MNLKHVESFLWIQRLGSFSAAARRLNTSQPAISMRIAELEKTLGVTLFDRRARAMKITPEGREFADYARRITDLTTEVQIRLSDHSQYTGRINLGVTESVALTWLPELVVRINEEFPAMVIDLDVDLTNVIWRKLRAGQLDLAILPGPAFGSDLSTKYLGDIRYTWMASPKLGFEKSKTQFNPQDLSSVPVITLSEDSNMHDIIEHWFTRNKSVPHRIDVCNSLGVVAALTVAGLGIAMLPPTIFNDEIKAGALHELETGPSIDPLQFWAVQPSRHVSPITKIISDYAQQASTFDFSD